MTIHCVQVQKVAIDLCVVNGNAARGKACVYMSTDVYVLITPTRSIFN